MPAPSDAPIPVLRVTQYDRAAAGVIAAFVVLAVICVAIVSLWMSTRPVPVALAVPVEIVDLPGGFLDGSIDETLRVDAAGPEVFNASPADEVSTTQLEIAESLESSTSMSDIAGAAAPTQQQFETGGTKNIGQKGSAKGTGPRPYGFGGPGAGLPREQRWFVRFDSQVSLDEYAKQLDFFKIELGALLPDGRLAILSQTAQPKPALRYIARGSDEQRLFMTWQGGERRFADVQLFAKAGVTVPGDAPLFQFYPKDIEAQLATLERDYRNRTAREIKRTYFVVIPQGAGFGFQVVRQTLHQQ
ncbi:MAG TPA: hypothetical protein VFG20_11515 [Planctomycetaceae bacterium]|nr:hypothetical protein [Planctomycetaceae bacterium]